MTVKGTDLENYVLRRKGGRSLIDYPPIFSQDGMSLLLICDNTVRIYNVKTGECCRVLEPEYTSEQLGTLMAICILQEEPHNLYGCFSNGYVTVWSWEAGGVLREKSLPAAGDIREGTKKKSKIKILSFEMLEPGVCLYTHTDQNNYNSVPHLNKFCFKTDSLLSSTKLSMKNRKIWKVVVGWCNQNQFAAICDGSSHLYIYNLSRPKEPCLKHVNQNSIRILTIAAHPTESALVSGDALGRAIVWKGNLFSKNDVGKEVLHWHNLPLVSAAFSIQGSFLLTGGMEQVVVKWHLGALAGQRQQREVMPRLPGGVRHIAVSVTHMAFATNENSIIVTTPQLSVVSCACECGGLRSKPRGRSAGLLVHRPLGALLVGGRVGHLQLVSTTTDKLLYNVDITGFNKLPISRENPSLADTDVTCAAVSPDGDWLVTSEYRNDGHFYPEERLKFWAFVPDDACPFALNTVVNLSHGGCKVTWIQINNTSDYTVTAGTDQKFRVWRRDFSLVNQKRQICWQCLTACYYASGVGASLDQDVFKRLSASGARSQYEAPHLRENKDDFISEFLGISEPKRDDEIDVGAIRKREAIEADLELGGVAISQDGSLIAAWFGSKLTLWDSQTCGLRSVLSHPSLRSRGVHVVFGCGDAAHYLVCTTQRCLVVWSLLSLSVKWLVHAQPIALAADPDSNRIAVVTDSNDVFVFTPHSSTPLLSRRTVLQPSAGQFTHCAFAASSGNRSRLYLTRDDAEIYCLEPASSEPAHLETISRVTLPVSNFGALVAEKQVSAVKKRNGAKLDNTNLPGNVTSVFSSASHMMPSIGLLSTSFLQQLSGIVEEAEPDTEPMVVDSSSEEEEDKFTPKTTPKKEFWLPNYGEVDEKSIRKIAKAKRLEDSLVKSILRT